MTEVEYTAIEALATAARPVDDHDWGSERQTTAQNAFFVAVEQVLRPAEFAALEEYCLHATSDEMIDRALAVLVDHLPRQRR